MRSRELEEAESQLRRLLRLKEVRYHHDRELRRALRELSKMRKEGRFDKRRVGLTIATISTILVEHFLAESVLATNKQ